MTDINTEDDIDIEALPGTGADHPSRPARDRTTLLTSWRGGGPELNRPALAG